MSKPRKKQGESELSKKLRTAVEKRGVALQPPFQRRTAADRKITKRLALFLIERRINGEDEW